jgi:hypothetical protein
VNRQLEYNASLKLYKDILKLRAARVGLREIGALFGISHQAVSARIHSGPPKEKTPDPFWVDKPKWQRSGRDFVREQVRARDGYKCQNCPKRWLEGMRRLDVHHLEGMCGKKSKGYDALKDMAILITLCHRCHFARHDFSQRLKV